MRLSSLTVRIVAFALLGMLAISAQTATGPYDIKADAHKDIAVAQQRQDLKEVRDGDLRRQLV